VLAICASISFNIRKGIDYREIAGRESIKGWTGTYFYYKDVPTKVNTEGILAFVKGSATSQDSWDKVS
jgi:hypothetical protein